MSKPYDAATKRLIELRPADWVRFLGLPDGPVSLVDADLSTISAAADRLIRVDAAANSYLVHNELESGKDTANVGNRLFHYGALADYKYGLPVISSVFLLRKESNSPALTGRLQRHRPDGTPYLSFEYNVIRVWEQDVETILAGGLGMLPLAPLANVNRTDVPSVIQRMNARVEAEATSDAEAGELWTATYVLLGLRFNREFNAQLLKGIRRMKESVTYQAILEEGEQIGIQIGIAKGERDALLRIGVKRFGPLSPAIESRIKAIVSLETLQALLDRVTEVETWDELLLLT